MPKWKFRIASLRHGILTVRDRLVDILPLTFEKLRPAMMLNSECLCCGKVLTDPISMAQWSGPECAGTATGVVPYMVLLH
jgi:hypothetical protein